jgi:hypothetical protein
MKKIRNKWKRRQNQYWRVDFGLYQVSSNVGHGGDSGSVYSGSHNGALEFYDSLLFNFFFFL